jgi:hypothetical protein
VVYLQSRQLIDVTQDKKYSFDFKAAVEKGTFTNKLYSYPQIVVPDSSQISRSVFYEEVPNSFTGVDSVEITNPGREYTTAEAVISGDGTGATASVTLLNGRIISMAITNKGINYSRAVVTINGDGVEGAAKAILQARTGTLRTYYYDNLGNKIIVDEEAGTIDYDTGLVKLNSIKPSAVVANDYYDTNILTMNVVADDEVILPLRNRILTMDDNNIQTVQVEMVTEK